MNYMWFKLPIYFILWRKAIQISNVRAKLEKAKTLTPEDDSILVRFMAAYGIVFVWLLCS